MKKNTLSIALTLAAALGSRLNELPGQSKPHAHNLPPQCTNRKWRRRKEAIAKASRRRNRLVKHS